MIFVTVGTQLHFDRMAAAVDRWAGERGVTDVFAVDRAFLAMLG